MPARLSNINLIVRDVYASKMFYTTLLGLTEPEERDGPRTMALLYAGSCTISLQDAEAIGHTVGPVAGIEIGFEVDDVDATWSAIKAAGADVRGEPVEQSFGRTFDARDPDGHSLVIFRLPRE